MKHTFCLALIFTLGFQSLAQERDLQLHPSFYALVVQDMDQSLAWYQQNLGFQVDDLKILEARGLKIANLSHQSLRLELIEFQQVIRPNQLTESLEPNTRVAGVFKIGFDIVNFEEFVTTLKAKNVEFRGDVVEDPITGKKMVIILDPDGNRIQLFDGN